MNNGSSSFTSGKCDSCGAKGTNANTNGKRTCALCDRAAWEEAGRRDVERWLAGEDL